MLTAPRFHNDPVLDQCLAGTRVMTFGETGGAVTLVQEALIDLVGGVGPAGANGIFNFDTGNALILYKTNRGLLPPTPVVDVPTMTVLDFDCADKPPPPFSDRAEWRSWVDRAAAPRAGSFNFTRLDEFNRRNAGKVFQFDALSSWMPAPFAGIFLDHLSTLIDPAGSPAGPIIQTPSWGVGPFDFFHCHVVMGILAGGAFPHLVKQSTQVQNELARLQELATLNSGAPLGSDPWSVEHARLLRTVGVTSLLVPAGALLADVLRSATPAQMGLIGWHTFEKSNWRPPMASSDPRRHWMSICGPTPQRPVPSPFTNTPAFLAAFSHLMTLEFVIDKNAVVTVLPGDFNEVASVTGITPDVFSNL